MTFHIKVIKYSYSRPPSVLQQRNYFRPKCHRAERTLTRVADGAVVALAIEGAVEAPRVARTPLFTPGSSVSRGAPTLAVPATDAAVLAVTRLTKAINYW